MFNSRTASLPHRLWLSSDLKLKRLLLIFLFILPASRGSAQAEQFEFKGYLLEYNTLTPVVNAVIRTNTGLQVQSNENGAFSLTLRGGTYKLTITHLAYDTVSRSIEISQNAQLSIYMQTRTASMKEVTITGAQGSNPGKLAPGSQTLTKKDLEKLPSFLGQRDPIRALQTLPGAGKGGEGNSGFYVRGGTSGQNLTVFNDAVIYNPSHLLGFFSVFNNYSVDNVKLYKSGIPAEYGGRLSSIIEVNSSREIADSLVASADISMLSANATINIPINPYWSVSTSARKTFMNYTVWPIINSMGFGSGSFDKMNYDFFDLNLNSNARIGKNDYLHFSAYHGGDDFGFNLNKQNISNGMDWQNTAYSLSWKRLVGNAMAWNNTASYSGYNFKFGMTQDKFEAGIASGINDYHFKSHLDVFLQKHHIKTGLQYTTHKFKPNSPFAKSVDTEYNFGTPNTYYSDESSFFVSDEFSLTEKTGFYAGLRLNHYRHKGPYTLTADDNSEVRYDKNAVVSSFTYLEPSLTFRHRISKSSSVKLAFTQNVQPIHLISITAVNFPADFWMPSLSKLLPEKGNQFSAGYFLNHDNDYESYIDLYYKNMTGLIEFSGGIMNLVDNLKIEDHLQYGSGTAYGAEVFIKKKTGKLTGWVGYTLSKSTRDFDQINESKRFPAKYDRRHDLSLVGNYQLTKRWNLSGSTTYATGSAYTKPTSRYLFGGNIVNEYGAFNGSRMPAYHRLDLATTYKLKAKERFTSEVSFSVYNVYSRQNPVYIYFLAEGSLEEQRVTIKPKSLALLPVLPSINYRLTFK